MPKQRWTSVRGTALTAVFAAIAATALAPAAAGAEEPESAALGALSPRLAELARPALDSAPVVVQDERLDLAPSGPGSLQRRGREILVNVRFERGAIARLTGLESAGAQVLTASRRYQTVAVAVDPTDLRELAGAPGVVSLKESLEPVVRAATTAAGGPGTCEGGEVISEGLGQLRVGQAREQFGLRGKGVTVGVLSDSFDTATEAADGSGPVATRASRDIEGNDLPGTASSCSGQLAGTAVFSDFDGGFDEGRAMLQIVHDLAPHAGLAYATAFQGELSFAQNIELLGRPVAAGGAGAGVIADDVGYFEEPFFQDGPVAAAINEVTAAGATYLTAAGNENIFEGDLESGNEIGSWEAPSFRDAASCPAAVEAEVGAGANCMDFDPGGEAGEEDGTFAITLEPNSGFILDLQWAEPWFGVEADLDAFVLSAGEVVAEATDNNTASGTQRPVELLQVENEGLTPKIVELVINRCVGPCNPSANPSAAPRLKFILLEEGDGVASIEYPESAEGDVVGPTIYGHAGAPSAISLGAVRYSNSNKPEAFSSRGPVTHYFAPVSGKEPAAELAEPELVAKPDFVATDCGATTFFASVFAGAWRFCGTSAAAPHAAAVAALLAQGAPTAGNVEIREALVKAAAETPVGAFGPEAVGAGLLDAVAALEQLGVTPTADDPPSTVVSPVVPPLPPPEVPPQSVPPVVVPRSAPAPSTFFRHKPPKLVRTAKSRARVVFRFGSNQADVAFLFRVDGARGFRSCGLRLVRHLKPGRHVLRVKARNSEGSVDRSPAVYRFRVLSRR